MNDLHKIAQDAGFNTEFDDYVIDNWKRFERFAELIAALAQPEQEPEQEIERLRMALRYEENRFSRIGTHGPDCWKWGPGHYECALRQIGGEE